MTDTDLLHTRYWRAFSPDHDRTDAVQRYETRYGRAPEHVVLDLGVLWLGPLPESDIDSGRVNSTIPHTGAVAL